MKFPRQLLNSIYFAKLLTSATNNATGRRQSVGRRKKRHSQQTLLYPFRGVIQAVFSLSLAMWGAGCAVLTRSVIATAGDGVDVRVYEFEQSFAQYPIVGAARRRSSIFVSTSYSSAQRRRRLGKSFFRNIEI